MLDVETREIARVVEARHRAPDDGLSTMEIVALERLARAARGLPDPDSGIGWAAQLSATVLVGGTVTSMIMFAVVRAIEFWTVIVP